MRILRAAGLLGLLLCVPTSLSATDAAAAMRRMTAALEPALDVAAWVEFIIDNAPGERVLWKGRYQRLSTPPIKRFVLEKPGNVAGVVLVLEGGPADGREARVYLPFVRRTRGIEEEVRAASFLGSDFSFEDLGFVDTESYEHTVQGEEVFHGRPCLRVDSVAKRKSPYSRISRCLDKRDWLPRRTEYFNHSGDLYKVRTMVVDRADGHQTPVRVTMEVLPEKTKTTMILTDVEYNVGLNPEMLQAKAIEPKRARRAGGPPRGQKDPRAHEAE